MNNSRLDMNEIEKWLKKHHKFKAQGEKIRKSEDIMNSGRCSDLVKKIEDPELRIFSTSIQRSVFTLLLSALVTEYECLIYDYNSNERSSRALFAWRARNLLEINTLCRYCCADDNNAEEIFREGAIDQLNLEDAFENFARKTKQPKEYFEVIENKKRTIREQAEKFGINDIDSKPKYRGLRDIASHIGFKDEFLIHNKILSKFAHPTAMLLFSDESQQSSSKRAFYFVSQGSIYFQDAFARLENFVAENYQLGKTRDDKEE